MLIFRMPVKNAIETEEYFIFSEILQEVQKQFVHF